MPTENENTNVIQNSIVAKGEVKELQESRVDSQIF